MAKFLVCKHCGNLVEVINDKKVPLTCCGEKMLELKAGEVEASLEKHIPNVEIDGNIVTVTVGSVIHPMVEEHFIAWVYLKTDKGGYRKPLVVGSEPTTTFMLNSEKALEVYAYCNLHGLWKIEL